MRVTLLRPGPNKIPMGLHRYCDNLIRAMPSDLDLRVLPLLRRGWSRVLPYSSRELMEYAVSRLLLDQPEGLIHALDIRYAVRGTHIITIHDLIPLTHPGLYSASYTSSIQWAIALQILGGAKHLIVASEKVRRQCIEMLNWSPKDLTLIPYGVDTDFFNIDPEVIRQEGMILYVGSDSLRKNLTRLVEAVAKLGPGVRLLWAGGSSFIQERERALGRAAELEVDMKYLGFVSDDELRRLYNSASAFVYVPYEEGFGLPPLEALACGTPVVVSRIESQTDHLTEDVATFVDPLDPSDLARGLRAALQSPVDSRRLRAWAMRFNWVAAASKVVEVYRTVGGGG